VGQKTHPKGFRLGITKTWDSNWYAQGRKYSEWIKQDEEIRKDLKKKLYHAGVSRVEIERPAGKIIVNVYVARPGLAIGKKGAGIDALRAELQQGRKEEIVLNIKEVRKAELDAQLVAEGIATQLERRIAFRRAMKKSVISALKLGAEGIRIQCSGRLAGAEIARSEWYREGRVPLQTLRADIDFGFAEAMTTYGRIGVKTWIYKGDIL
jgi:small subunit ribosomal protein S3